jgi:hypothetical protein
MWQHAHFAAVGFTQAVGRATHAAPPSTWAIVVGAGLCALLAMLCLRVALVSNRQPPGREGDDDHGSGPSGGGPGRPGPDGGDPPGSTPEWWLDFEREFAALVSEQTASLR